MKSRLAARVNIFYSASYSSATKYPYLKMLGHKNESENKISELLKIFNF